MLRNKTIGFIGAGNMAEALIKGLVNRGSVPKTNILAADALPERTALMAEKYGIRVFSKNFELVKASDIVFLSVKPKDTEPVLKDIANELTKEKILVSIVAGKTTSSIREALHSAGLTHHLSIIRAMPNTPALIGQGAIGMFSCGAASEKEVSLVKELFSSVGETVIMEDESLLDAVTGLSGSGPAYVFLFIEAMIEAGVKAGLTKEISKTLTLKTILGAARLAAEGGQSTDNLIKMVASPGGTTVEGLNVLNDSGLKKIVSEAVLAATRRSKELSGQ